MFAEEVPRPIAPLEFFAANGRQPMSHAAYTNLKLVRKMKQMNIQMIHTVVRDLFDKKNMAIKTPE
jgi:hypothetical protein